MIVGDFASEYHLLLDVEEIPFAVFLPLLYALGAVDCRLTRHLTQEKG